MERKQVAILIDENNFLWRAAGATSMTVLTNSKGKVTGHVFNFVRMLLQYWYEADAVVFVEDRRPQRKYDLYPEYKAGRKEKLTEDNQTFNMVKELRDVMPLLPFTHAYADKEEADDVIASVATRFEGMGYDVRIISSDRDLWQLINTAVTVESTKTITEEMIEKNFHISKAQARSHLVLAKALKGDASDNIPPVASRMMSKDLSRLIKMTDGTIQSMLDICKADESTTAKKILENETTLRRNYQLCDLKKDLPVLYYKHDGNEQKLTELLTEYECKSVVPKVPLLFKPPANYKDITEAILIEENT